jgi:hypothetical protein
MKQRSEEKATSAGANYYAILLRSALLHKRHDRSLDVLMK